MGPFDGYADNREPMLRVIGKHRDAADESTGSASRRLLEAARDAWDERSSSGESTATATPRPPCSPRPAPSRFMMDCDTTGIEPDIALVKYKKLVGGGMLKIVNRTVPLALASSATRRADRRHRRLHRRARDHRGRPDLKDEHLPVFDCAFKPATASAPSTTWATCA